eukprot:12138095-Alexandrium_andersonii.AAC.1
MAEHQCPELVRVCGQCSVHRFGRSPPERGRSQSAHSPDEQLAGPCWRCRSTARPCLGFV